MKIKTFWTRYFNDDGFDPIVNEFIKNKKIIQFLVSEAGATTGYSHVLTVVYEEAQHDTRTD